MLNFCPDLLCEPLELQKATRELLFLVDRSGSMSGTNIHRIKVSCNRSVLVYVGLNAAIFGNLVIYTNMASIYLFFSISIGRHGGGPEESPCWHHAQHCGLRHHPQAPVHLQQALH